MTARCYPALAAAALLSLFAGHVFAAHEEALPGVVDGLKAFAVDGKVRHSIVKAKVEVGGKSTDQAAQEIWYQGDDRLRVDQPTGNFVMVVAPDGATMFHARAGVALVAKGEAFEKLGKAPADRQRGMGVNPPPALLDRALAEETTFSIEAEDTLDERPCWVMAVAPERVEPWGKIVFGEQPVKLDTLRIGVDKESYIVRGVYVAGSAYPPNGAAPIEIKVTMSMMGAENGVDVPEGFFSIDVPEGTKVIEWQVDARPVDMLTKFRDAIAQGLRDQEAAEAGAQE